VEAHRPRARPTQVALLAGLALAAGSAQALLVPLGLPGLCQDAQGLPAPPLCGAWRRVADLPVAVDGPGVAWDPTAAELLVFGGRDATGQLTGALWAVDPSAGTSRALAPGPPRADMGFALDPAHRVAYAWGGRDAAGTPLGDLWRYDVGSDTWALVVAPDAPVPVWGPAAVWDDVRGVLWVYGGHDTAHQRGDLERYDPATNTWWLGPNAPAARYFASLVRDADRDVLLLHGGQADPNAELPELWQYDPTADRWSASTPSYMQRAHHAAVWDPHAGAMLVFGGTTLQGQRVAESSVFGPIDAIGQVPLPLFRAGLWASQAPLPEARTGLGAAWDEATGRAYVAGGRTDAGPTSEVDAFTPGLLADAVG